MFKLNHKLMEEELGAEGTVISGGEASGSWYDSFAEDIRSNQNVTKFSSAEELAKSYINAQSLIGRDKIPMPVTDEDWSNTYARLGRPEDAAGYEFNVPEGVQVNEERQGAFRELAYQIGLSQKQAEALMNFDFESQNAALDAYTTSQHQATEEAIGSLQKEWGNAFEQNVTIANRALSEFASESDIEFLQEAEINGVKLGDHPVLIKLFNNVGKGMMESGKLEGKGSDLVMTPDEVQAKQAQLMAHPAYTDRNHPEHKVINGEVQKLFKLQYPD